MLSQQASGALKHVNRASKYTRKFASFQQTIKNFLGIGEKIMNIERPLENYQ